MSQNFPRRLIWTVQELVRRGVSREDMEAGLHETFGEHLHRGQVSGGGHHADHHGAHGGGAQGGGEDVQSERLIRLIAVVRSCCAAAPEL